MHMGEIDLPAVVLDWDKQTAAAALRRQAGVAPRASQGAAGDGISNIAVA